MLDDRRYREVLDGRRVRIQRLDLHLEAGVCSQDAVAAALVASLPVLPASRRHPEAVDEHDRVRCGGHEPLLPVGVGSRYTRTEAGRCVLNDPLRGHSRTLSQARNANRHGAFWSQIARRAAARPSWMTSRFGSCSASNPSTPRARRRTSGDRRGEQRRSPVASRASCRTSRPTVSPGDRQPSSGGAMSVRRTVLAASVLAPRLRRRRLGQAAAAAATTTPAPTE